MYRKVHKIRLPSPLSYGLQRALAGEREVPSRPNGLTDRSKESTSLKTILRVEKSSLPICAKKSGSSYRGRKSRSLNEEQHASSYRHQYRETDNGRTNRGRARCSRCWNRRTKTKTDDEPSRSGTSSR